MARMIAPDPHCKGVDTDRRRYNADRAGFVHVDDHRDVRALKDGGFIVAGSTPVTTKRWVCECGWEALINHCPKCGRSDLTRIED